MAITLQTVLTE